MTRSEEDALGALELPADSLYGINTARALLNFDFSARKRSIRCDRLCERAFSVFGT